MSYNATVFKVMIASPGDVSAERGVVRDVLNEWNIIHSEKSGAVLLPVGWETHSAPEMSGPAQSILNRTVLKDCDLLVGIFWTRIGTPTENYDSGTVEEIERHIASNKPTMLYFSSAPIIPDSVDPDQYRHLKQFKESCKSRGLLEGYADLQEFRSKFSRQIQLKINQESYFASLMSQRPEISDIMPQKLVITLSSEAKELLSAACSTDGRIMFMRFIGGEAIQAGRRSFIEQGNPRSRATWEGALGELESHRFVEPLGYKREMFQVTREGYDFHDSNSNQS